MIYLKSAAEISKLRAAAALWSRVVGILKPLIVPHNTPRQLAKAAEACVVAAGGKCVFKNYKGFPGTICVSVNEVCIHGVPHDRPFKSGDKVGVDIGIGLNGVICDAGFSHLIDPRADEEYASLVYHTYHALMAGVQAARANNFTGDIATAISQYVATNCPRFSILDDFCGHGCGLQLHEDPIVPNKDANPGTGVRLVNGMTICIEPILTTQPTGDYFIDPHDQWGVRVQPGHKTCHWECMVVIQDVTPEILTVHELPQWLLDYDREMKNLK